MDLVSRNVLRHVYEALLTRKRKADSGNISNLQLFYNQLTRAYRTSEKRGQCLLVPLTGQDVDDFYARQISQETFVELVRIKVISKLPHFDPSVLHNLCWECFSELHDSQLTRAVMMVTKQSATLLWLLFCKLDTEGKLKLHPEDVIELIIRLLTHLRVTPDRKEVEVWLGNKIGSLIAWVDFWPFFILIVDNCLAPRGAQATNRGVQVLYDEVVNEVMKFAQMTKKGHIRHTWKMRWFVLTTTDLFYYESKESLVKKGAVVLNAHASVEVMQDKNVKDNRYPNRFKVVDGISQQATEISAESLTQMNEWVEAINTAIKLNSVEGRNYIHRLQLLRTSINISDGQHGSLKSPVMHSYSVQLSSVSSMDTASEMSDSSGNNKSTRKINSPVMNTNPLSFESTFQSAIPKQINEKRTSTETGGEKQLYTEVQSVCAMLKVSQTEGKLSYADLVHEKSGPPPIFDHNKVPYSEVLADKPHSSKLFRSSEYEIVARHAEIVWASNKHHSAPQFTQVADLAENRCLQQSQPQYVAMFDYKAVDDDEVSFIEGDFIVDADIIDEGWIEGRVERTGQHGMLPSNYVKIV